jgi:hypothetical protein
MNAVSTVSGPAYFVAKMVNPPEEPANKAAAGGFVRPARKNNCYSACRATLMPMIESCEAAGARSWRFARVNWDPRRIKRATPLNYRCPQLAPNYAGGGPASYS